MVFIIREYRFVIYWLMDLPVVGYYRGFTYIHPITILQIFTVCYRYVKLNYKKGTKNYDYVRRNTNNKLGTFYDQQKVPRTKSTLKMGFYA